MASNPYLADLTQRMQHLRDLGGQAVQAVSHPINTVESLLGMPLAPTHSQPTGDAHQQAIDEINRQTNSHANDGANQSFARRKMPTK